jgi:hypothetical protein
MILRRSLFAAAVIAAVTTILPANPARGLLRWRPEMSNVSTIAPMIDLVRAVQSGTRSNFQEMLRATQDPVVLGGLSR